MNASRGVAVIIPTRNRAGYAINAIRSVMRQSIGDRMSVLVSDNSTDAHDSSALSEFCEQLQDSRLTYVKCQDDLSMTHHWNWALSRATGLFRQNHFLFLTDRMIFRDGSLAELLPILTAYPQDVVSYSHDRIDDLTTPVALELNPWTGSVLKVSCSKRISKAAGMTFHPSLPRMLNCAVPRSVLTAITARFGTVFDSVSPDFCFCFRLLGMQNHILYYDKPILVQYGMNRSNGASTSMGLPTRDHMDFRKHLPRSHPALPCSPLPEVLTVGNAIINEYSFVNRELGMTFPPINMNKYLHHIAIELLEFRDGHTQSKLFELLRLHGWRRSSRLSRYKLYCKIQKVIFPGFKFATTSRALMFARCRLLPKSNRFHYVCSGPFLQLVYLANRAWLYIRAWILYRRSTLRSSAKTVSMDS